MFFWDMAQCLWVNGAQHCETTDWDYERLSEVFWTNENNVTRYANVKLKFNNFIIKNICLKKKTFRLRWLFFWNMAPCHRCRPFWGKRSVLKTFGAVMQLLSALSQKNGGYNCTAVKPKTSTFALLEKYTESTVLVMERNVNTKH